MHPKYPFHEAHAKTLLPFSRRVIMYRLTNRCCHAVEAGGSAKLVVQDAESLSDKLVCRTQKYRTIVSSTKCCNRFSIPKVGG